MSKVLVSFFSATGTTRKVAEEICKVENGDLYEIVPKTPYTKQDLDYTVKDSRSNVEMADESSRPAFVKNVTASPTTTPSLSVSRSGGAESQASSTPSWKPMTSPVRRSFRSALPVAVMSKRQPSTSKASSMKTSPSKKANA